MSYNFSFADNAVYSAADVNKITSRLVTSGIEDPFADGVPYNLSAFNDAGTLLYTDGVVPETVNTLKVVKREEEGEILIYPGTAFFHDGSVIEIESGGEMLSYTQDAKNYVYLKNDLINQNACYPVCSVESPVGDYVLLAEISENGEISDKRTYAKGKLPGYASSADYSREITDTIEAPRGSFTEQKIYDIGENKYRFLVLYQEGTVLEVGQDKLNYILGIYSFETGKLFSVDCKSSFSGKVYTSDTDFFICSNGDDYSAKATISVSDGKLILDISGYASYARTLSYTMYLF